MKEIQAPNDFGRRVFLAGSIEMGVAERWQDRIVRGLKDVPVTILNPRRDDWDSSWRQSIDDENFNEQVTWELKALDGADIILMYFDPNTKSPISLLELGLYAQSGKMVVCCPDGFWKKGNVDIVCDKYDIPQVSTVYALAEFVRMAFFGAIYTVSNSE